MEDNFNVMEAANEAEEKLYSELDSLDTTTDQVDVDDTYNIVPTTIDEPTIESKSNFGATAAAAGGIAAGFVAIFVLAKKRMDKYVSGEKEAKTIFGKSLVAFEKTRRDEKAKKKAAKKQETSTKTGSDNVKDEHGAE